MAPMRLIQVVGVSLLLVLSVTSQTTNDSSTTEESTWSSDLTQTTQVDRSMSVTPSERSSYAGTSTSDDISTSVTESSFTGQTDSTDPTGTSGQTDSTDPTGTSDEATVITSTESDNETTTVADNTVGSTTAEEPPAFSSAQMYPFDGGEDLLAPYQGYTFNTGDSDQVLSNQYLSYKLRSHCHSRAIGGGRVGVPYFNERFQNIYICDNGLMSFADIYRTGYPVDFGVNSFYKSISLIGPMWIDSNPYATKVLAEVDSNPDLESKVYYKVHEENGDSTDSVSRDILNRSASDVQKIAPELGFTPSLVMVVTWINMVPNVDGCRSTALFKYYADWWLQDMSMDYLQEEMLACAEKARNAPVNHLQAVFISNGVYSFIKYIYPDGGVSWVDPTVLDYSEEYLEFFGEIVGSSTPLTGSAGFWSGDETAFMVGIAENLPGSRSLALHKIDEQVGNAGEQGEWLFRVDNSDGELSPAQVCVNYVDSQNDVVIQSQLAIVNFMVPCRFFVLNAQFSGWYSNDSYDGEDQCLKASWPFGNYTQRCCYRKSLNWNLLPQLSDSNYVTDGTEEEATGYRACCYDAPEYCGLFQTVRPLSPPVFIPVIRRLAIGDPHLTTLDGIDYTFNGHGEYMYVNADDEVIVQIRTARVIVDGELAGATYVSAVAIADDTLPPVFVEVVNTTSTALTSQLNIYYNDSMVDFSGLVEGNNSQTLDGVSESYRFDIYNGTLGITVRPYGVNLNISNSMGFMVLGATVPNTYEGKTKGLLGLMDRDSSNDFLYPSGNETLLSNSTQSEIFPWGQLWSVSDADSLMYYPVGQSAANYSDATYTPLFADDIDSFNWTSEEFKNQTMEACGTDEQCIMDVFVTGNLAVGQATKRVTEEAKALSETLENSPPTVTGPSNITVTVGEEFTVQLATSDLEGDALSVSTVPDTALINMTGGNVEVTYTLNSNEMSANFTLQVYVTDAKGASVLYQPRLFLCGCMNNGTCMDFTTAELELTTAITLVQTCRCLPGFNGDYCETDEDGCALVLSPCYVGVECTDNPAPDNGYTCGDCPAGYSGDGASCSDINECLNGTQCAQQCANLPGSYACTCNTGYALNADSINCDDIDECLLNPCHQTCNNTAGSFACGCEDGWSLSSDNINCEPANPCDTSNQCDNRTNIGYCSKGENNTQTCLCGRGYELQADGFMCGDINECARNVTNICQHQCNNTEGSFDCLCNAGYKLASNGASCVDINECITGAYNCSITGSSCSNTLGSYNCACPADSVLSNGVCAIASTNDPVIIGTEQNSVAEVYNSITVELSGITLAQYTVAKEAQLFDIIAAEATAYCTGNNTGDCATGTAAPSRRRRATNSYTASDVKRIAGYPRINNAGNLEVRIYVVNSDGSGAIPVQTLSSIITTARPSVTSTLGVTVVSISAATTAVPTSTTTTTTTTTPAATISAADAPTSAPNNNNGLYIGVGVAGGLVGLGLIILIVILVIKKSKSQKVGQMNVTDPDDPPQAQRKTEQTQRQPSPTRSAAVADDRPSSSRSTTVTEHA